MQIIAIQTLSGPTNFTAVIDDAINHVVNTGKYHILLIITDGAVQDEKAHYEVLNKASKFALSIVCVGVGDGPWDAMKRYETCFAFAACERSVFFSFDDEVVSGRVLSLIHI